jgi:hypothetical protein
MTGRIEQSAGQLVGAERCSALLLPELTRDQTKKRAAQCDPFMKANEIYLGGSLLPC